jgi:hypothetical protein
MHNPRHNSPVSMLWHKHRLTALAIIVAAGTLVTTALATTDHHRSADRRRAAPPRNPTPVPAGSRFAVLAHPVARASATGPYAPPPGAVYAASVGQHEIFALQRSGPETPGAPEVGAEVCLVDQEGSDGGGMACSAAAKAEQEGVELLSIETGTNLTDAVLVPNGVTSVEFTDHDGSSRTVQVTNNVAVVEDPDLASLHYTVPGGVSKSTDIAEVTSRG